MVRELWSDIVSYYSTYPSFVRGYVRDFKRLVIDSDPSALMDEVTFRETLQVELSVDGKYNDGARAKFADAEFARYFMTDLMSYSLRFISEVREDMEPEDIKHILIDWLEEVNVACTVLLEIPMNLGGARNSLLGQYIAIVKPMILPDPTEGASLGSIYADLHQYTAEWFELQRQFMVTAKHYQERLEQNDIPGLSPTVYKLLNMLTSYFNLDPSYDEDPDAPGEFIPVVMKEEVFEPFVGTFAESEEQAFPVILKRAGLQLLYDVLIAPTRPLLEMGLEQNYFVRGRDPSGGVRWLAQFSNETLFLSYLAQMAKRRGFLTKQLVNWITANAAYIYYATVFAQTIGPENIFRGVLLDLRTLEKILPYMQKLICFPEFLNLDRTKVHDSPIMRREMFSAIGEKLEILDYFVDRIGEMLGQQIKARAQGGTV